jgi:hypothetical protein
MTEACKHRPVLRIAVEATQTRVVVGAGLGRMQDLS